MTALQYLEKMQKEQVEAGILASRDDEIDLFSHLINTYKPRPNIDTQYLHDKYNKTIELCPSKYQCIHEYSLLYDSFDGLKKMMEAGILVLNNGKTKWKEIPTFGTLVMNEFSAYITPIGNADDPLIVFSQSILKFASRICTAIAISFPIVEIIDGEALFSMDITKIANLLKTNKNGTFRFIDLMTAQLLFGSPVMVAPLYTDAHYHNSIATLYESFQTFIVAHEYSHYLEGHVGLPYLDPDDYADGEAENIVLKNYEQELTADKIGSVMTVASLMLQGGRKPLSYAGVYLCLHSIGLLNRMNNIKLGRDEDYFNSKTHPPANWRMRMFIDLMDEEHKKEKDVLDSCNAIDFLVDHYWKEFRRFFDTHIVNIIKNKTKVSMEDFRKLEDTLYRMYQ